MGQDKTGYKWDRVLIEASRILSPQFDALGIYLTGAQVELLRNVVSVLDKPTTFVDEYHEGYYITVTDNDWDAIRSIVADLERKLMGNDNTLWGYNDRFLGWHSSADHSAGQQQLELMPVPEGFVYKIEHVAMFQSATSGGFHMLQAITNGTGIRIGHWIDTVAGRASSTPVCLTLKEGDSMRAIWGTTVEDEYLDFAAWGYKMKVPV